MDFRIRYRVQPDETKQETVIDQDGTVLIRNYERSGPEGHFRLSERAEGSAAAEDAEDLYRQIMDLLHRHENILRCDNADREIILEEPGIRISLDAGLSDGTVTGAELVEAFIDQAVLFRKSA